MSLLSPGTELKRFRLGIMPKVAIGVLLFIPLIYGALYLWAFWAPTDNFSSLPVALVNEDETATMSDGSSIAAGDDLVDELLDGQDLEWHVTSAAEASEGVADGAYYFSLTVPADFSATLAAIDSEDAEAGKLHVAYNDTNSFLASTLGQSAMKLVREAVAVSVTETAAGTVLEGTEELADGIRSASDAASELSDGAVTLDDGAARLRDGAAQVDDGTVSLADGVGQLADGAAQLSSSSSTLADGMSQLAGGVASAGSGAEQVAAGASSLSDGLATASDGATAVRDGAASLQSATSALPEQTGQIADGSSSLAELMQALQTLSTTEPYASMPLSSLDAILKERGTGLQKAVDGATALQEGTAQLSERSPALAGAAARLAAGSSALADGVTTASAGASSLADGSASLTAGLQNASSGASQLADGSAQLATGAATLSSRLQTASNGATQLAAGTSTLSEGAVTLRDGAGALVDGAGEFATTLADGAQRAPELTPAQITSTSELIATPVELDETTDNEVQGFGEGFAPFFIALATFVGALITWLILRALPRRPMGSNVSGLRAVLTGFVPAAAIGLGQVVIMMLVLVLAIGMRPVHWIGMSLFVLLTTLAFLALQQMFIILLGTAAGRVVSLVLLMFQLSSSGGTYPVETTPAFFQALHPFMPASYVVTGLRQLIGGGVDGRLWVAVAFMAGLLVVSLVVSAIAAQRQKVWTVARLHPELSI